MIKFILLIIVIIFLLGCIQQEKIKYVYSSIDNQEIDKVEEDVFCSCICGYNNSEKESCICGPVGCIEL